MKSQIPGEQALFHILPEFLYYVLGAHSTQPQASSVMKWLSILVVALFVIAICWLTGLLDQIASPFQAWLKWIGA